MEEDKLIEKVQNGELDMLGYVLLHPELKEPFMESMSSMNIVCPAETDAVQFLNEYEEQLYQNIMP